MSPRLPAADNVREATFLRPVEISSGVYVSHLGRVQGGPAMWLEGDYLVLSTGHRMHLAGGLVGWVKQ